MQVTCVASGIEITRCTRLSLRVIAKLQFVVKAALDLGKLLPDVSRLGSRGSSEPWAVWLAARSSSSPKPEVVAVRVRVGCDHGYFGAALVPFLRAARPEVGRK
jgi:hypothetical protein